MKYFIDFEAMQFSNYIISVGCVREDGKEFYSLVHTPENTKKNVSKFITDLTGITTEMVEAAPSPEEVFNKFFDFCFEDCGDDIPEFYCYGNCDTDFIKATFRKTNSFKAKAILGYMNTDMKDFAPAVKVHFGLIKLINLAKVCEYFRGEKIVQTHNSLDDAKMLKEVYEGCKNEKASDVDANVFMEYKEITTDQIEYEDTRFDVFCCPTKNFEEERTKKFENLKEAVEYVKSYDKSMRNNPSVNVNNVAKRIKKSYNTKKQYNYYYWKFEVK